MQNAKGEFASGFINRSNLKFCIFNFTFLLVSRFARNRSRSTMDSIRVSEALDSGSIPDGTTNVRFGQKRIVLGSKDQKA